MIVGLEKKVMSETGPPQYRPLKSAKTRLSRYVVRSGLDLLIFLGDEEAVTDGGVTVANRATCPLRSSSRSSLVSTRELAWLLGYLLAGLLPGYVSGHEEGHGRYPDMQSTFPSSRLRVSPFTWPCVAAAFPTALL
jgi:hypothetical protein